MAEAGSNIDKTARAEPHPGRLHLWLRALRESLPARIAAARRRPLLVGIGAGALTLTIAAIFTWVFFADQLAPMPPISPQKLQIINSKAPPPLLLPDLMPVAASDAKAINEKVPFATLHPLAARAFRFGGGAQDLSRAVDCLAAAAWYEAGDDAKGQKAVAQVIINRARHPAFPDSVCGVVFQGSERRTGCQFSFTCDGSFARTPSPAAWQRARDVAAGALSGEVYDPVGYATHYHADYVVPYWASSLDKIAMVGAHIFYRWPGYWGTPPSFRQPVGGTEPVERPLARFSPAHAEQPGQALLPGEEAALATPTTPSGLADPALMPKVSAAALRGNTITDASQDGSAIFLKLDAGAFPGSYAMTSLALCKGKRTCKVLGWRDPAAVGRSLPLSPESLRQVSFIYVKDMKRGIERALWNCGQVARPDSHQCLPADGPAVQRLLDPE